MRCIPIDHDGPTWCLECGVDTFEIGEFSYMVHPEVWLAAAPWNTAGGMFDFLCIGCLEARLGRQLTADDFLDVPLNPDSRITGASVCKLACGQAREA